MSQRPRLAGDGRLFVPAKVAFDHHGFIQGYFSKQPVDPFEWTEDRLLLAESFARVDLGDRTAVKAWWVRHGSVNARDLTHGDAALPEDHVDWRLEQPAEDDFLESRQEALDEQANVSWHLATLVRLSDNRETQHWDRAWGDFVLAGPGTAYLVGGVGAGAEVWSPSQFELTQKDPEASAGDLDAQIALQPEVARRPKVSVRPSGWSGYWGSVTPEGAELTFTPYAMRRFGADWEWAFEAERRLMEPYVAFAVERRFRTVREDQGADGRRVLVPREDRQWRSILAPVYLQLFEALRRISEGEPGAAVCRECGQPFLVLDARRRFFCNDRERFRYSQRARRRRLASIAIEEPES